MLFNINKDFEFDANAFNGSDAHCKMVKSVLCAIKKKEALILVHSREWNVYAK